MGVSLLTSKCWFRNSVKWVPSSEMEIMTDLRQKDFRAYHLHKGGSDGMDGGFLFHINRHIEAVVRDESLPRAITIGPIAAYAVRQSCVSLCQDNEEL